MMGSFQWYTNEFQGCGHPHSIRRTLFVDEHIFQIVMFVRKGVFHGVIETVLLENPAIKISPRAEDKLLFSDMFFDEDIEFIDNV